MIKNITLILSLAAFFTAKSQIMDSVTTGASNINDVYYSFSNGIVKSQPNSDWDLAFEISGFNASILANHVKGVLVWQSPYSYAKWSGFDSANHNSWKMMYNSPVFWNTGAFNLHANNNNDPYDLGWGTYNPSTHIVQGDSVFLLKLPNGSFKKLAIVNLNSGTYNIKYSDLDGSNEKTKSIGKSDFKGKNFGYFSFASETTLDREPASADWDIVFTKYIAFIPTPYAVAGVWTNKGIMNAEARNVPVSTTDFSPFNFSDSNSVIGYDWKTYNQSLNKYDITKNLIYFIKTASGNWKMVFTGYKGGGAGTYYFTKQTVTASVKEYKMSGNIVYPNPGNTFVNLKLSAGNTLIKYSISSVAGQRVLEGTGYGIDISNLKSGIYFITLHTDKGIQNLKFNKN